MEVKDVFRHPGARVGVSSARSRPLATHGVGCLVAGLNLETGQLSRHYKAEILLNVTLNHKQQTELEIFPAYEISKKYLFQRGERWFAVFVIFRALGAQVTVYDRDQLAKSFPWINTQDVAAASYGG